VVGPAAGNLPVVTRRVVFVATELDPVTPGGAGVVVAELARRLVASGTPVTVLLVAGAAPPPQTDGVEVITVPPGDAGFLERSMTAATALADLAAAGPVSRVEFQDFDGLGFWTLGHRTDVGLAGVPVTVRLHGPLDLLAGAMDAEPGDWGVPRVMERECFAMADAVLVPSGPIRDLVLERYGLEPERVVVGEPPVPALPGAPRHPAPAEFAVLGRLGEMKGSQDLVAAAVRLLDAGVDAGFRFIGGDGWSVAARRPMSEWLADMIPARHAGRIRFEPPVARQALPAALATVTAVVVPSRFESFCLAAHEARALGIPLLLNDLPAFAPYFSEATGAMRYDGTVDGLVAALGRLATEPDLVARLAAAPLPGYGDPLEPYRSPPAVRPGRAQAGLATAAVQRLEAATPPPRTPSRTARAARAVLRALPEPLARLAIRVVPARLKDRFRAAASWPAEAARRAEAERRRLVRDRVAAGAFSDVADPLVTVVIPCFDQGEYLEGALVSVFEQTLDSFEIVVVDDGSTDPETVATIDGIDLPRVRVVRQENRGLPAARNAGMALARGRYLVPLDADDELAPHFLADLVAVLEVDAAAGFAHCWAELFGDQDALWVTRPFNPYQELLSNSVVGCVVMRRDAWEAVGGYDESMIHGNEDWDLWIRLTAAGWGQAEVPVPLFRYRKHGVSMSVATEARYEQARVEMVRRHPGLYEAEALAATKREWYPLVTAILDGDGDPGALAEQDLDDVEVVLVAGADPGALAGRWPLRQAASFRDAVAVARGKYVADWSHFGSAAPGALSALAGALEAAPDALGAGPDAAAAPLLWRRWPLLDPTAPHLRTHAVPGATAAGLPPRLAPGAFPDPLWIPPPAGDRPVLRQAPEEEGRIPEWIVAARERPPGPGVS
jgi:glycosyltransferase involved in cell wall biosynthesis